MSLDSKMRGERMDTVGGLEVLKENSYIFFFILQKIYTDRFKTLSEFETG